MIALYPGTFDPLTFGHINIVVRGLHVFGEVRVAVANNIAKSTVFDTDERMDMVREQF